MDSISFQILDWQSYQEDNIDDDQKQFVISLYGRTQDNRTIYVKVNKFLPYFYIELDKTWRKNNVDDLIQQIKFKVYKDHKDALVSYKEVSKFKFWGFTNYEKFNFLELTFLNYDASRAYSRALEKPILVRSKHNEPIKFNIYEANIEPFLRCMHIRNLDAMGWVSINKNDYTLLEADNSSICDINIETKWNKLNRLEDRSINKFTIASFDIECTSEDGSFPQFYRQGDKIIQIGTTFSRLGEDECYYKHIITLGSCDKLDDIVVESYNTEEQVLLAWTRLIQRTNPDIITGYNIFGFDFEYMKNRCICIGLDFDFNKINKYMGKHLECKHEPETKCNRCSDPDFNIEDVIKKEKAKFIKENNIKLYNDFSKLSRIPDKISEFKDSSLSSSALGKNILKYYDMEGRVLVDLMKVVQRDHKLDSYKLDNVAANFIKEKISKLTNLNIENHTMIDTPNTYGLKEEQFITIYYNDGITNNKHQEGKKFKIIKLTDKTILLDGLVEPIIELFNKGYKVYWCQAKDDISANDIFRMQKGTSKDRSIIAKYCIQDCVLCNKLIAKLQILINNIGMANVCHVPLSYLFMRGQGIKIFSLVAKFCRENNYLIPVLKKKKTDPEKENKDELQFEKFIDKLNGIEEDEDEGYEGAIVFEPETGIHYEPVTVLDYASLYPKSMIHKNLSHESYVIEDEKYGYLPDYKYNTISYITNNIVEPYDKHKLKLLLNSFSSSNNYIIEDIDLNKYEDKLSDNSEELIDSSKANINKLLMAQKTKIRKNYKIYDKDYLNQKRWLVSEIKTDNTSIYITNYETSKFAQKLDGSKSLIPTILMELLNARSKYKKEMNAEKDAFKASVLEGLQLAYKVTANSLYGQTGASTSAICMKQIAASTTATGREQLIYSKHFIENIYGNLINTALQDKQSYLDLCTKTFINVPIKKFNKKNKDPEEAWSSPEEFYEKFYNKMNGMLKGNYVNPKIIYGDTDSVFFKMNVANNETRLVGKDRNALAQSIQLGIWASYTICLLLEEPQEQAYEKVLWPFMIISKKRYVGNLYETDPNKFYQKSMGIVLKRRDNAPIVKIVCGGIVDYILNKLDPEGSIDFTKKALKDILSGKYHIDKFIITKTLKGPGMTKQELIKENMKDKDTRFYKDRSRITHAVLADRMAERDPGNKPLSNDRIPFVYIATKTEPLLQGDRVETPDYVLSNKLKLDYEFYITNQIQKPAMQFLDLIMDNSKKMFDYYIMQAKNNKKGQKSIKSYFSSNKEPELGELDILNDEVEHIDLIPKTKSKKIIKKKIILEKACEEPSFSLDF